MPPMGNPAGGAPARQARVRASGWKKGTQEVFAEEEAAPGAGRAGVGAGNGVSEIHGFRVSDFPPAATEPRVVARYEARPGEIPRKVAIERMKRLYAEQSLEALLAAEQVDLAAPPPTAVERALELALFDDDSEDIHGPEGWVALGGGGPVPALGHVEGVAPGRWLPVLVDGYDAAEGMFSATLRDGETPAGGLLLPRLAVHFVADDPFKFAKRLARAYRERAAAAKDLCYDLFLDSMPTDDLTAIDSHSLVRMTELAVAENRVLAVANHDGHLAEIQLDYLRAVNKSIFDASVRGIGRARKSGGLSGLSDLLVPHDLDFGLPVAFEPPEGVATSGQGRKAPLPAYNYKKQKADFTFNTFLTRREVIKALGKVKQECNKMLGSVSLYKVDEVKAVQLDEFVSSQGIQAKTARNSVQEKWSNVIKASVKALLKDVGKGWFNLNETNMETYESSKLKTFMTTIRYVMEDSLRFMTDDSLSKFAEFVSLGCAADVTVKSTHEVVNVIPDANRASGKRVLSFAIDLDIKGDSVRFTTATKSIVPGVLKVFDAGMAVLRGIKQVEQQIMDHLLWSHRPDLATVHPEEEHVAKARADITAALNENVEKIIEYKALYEEHKPLIDLKEATYMKGLKEFNDGEGPTLDELCEIIDSHAKDLAHLEAVLPSSVVVGVFHVNCKAVRSALMSKKAKLHELCIDLLKDTAAASCKKINKIFQEDYNQLMKKSATMEDVDAMRKLIKKLPSLVAENEKELSKTIKWYDALERYRIELSDSDHNARWKAAMFPATIFAQIELTEQRLLEEKLEFERQQKAEQEEFNDSIVDLRTRVDRFANLDDLSLVSDIAGSCRLLKQNLQEAAEMAALFNSRERLFGLPETPYPIIGKMSKDFDPYYNLWTIADDFLSKVPEWNTGEFLKLDRDEIEGQIENGFKTMARLSKSTAITDKVMLVVQNIAGQLKDFREKVPLIVALRTPGMRARHWEKLGEKLGAPVVADESLTLEALCELGLADPQYVMMLEELSELAGKEYALEAGMDKMEGEWHAITFDVSPYKKTGSYILKGLDEVQALLDDHIVKTQTMRGSPYIKLYEERIIAWDKKLMLVQETMDEWVKCQLVWCYLEPIFLSEDIMQQMPTEGKRFQTVDKVWRKVMDATHKSPSVIAIGEDERLCRSLRENNELLELVQKGLNDYLDTKRLAFPRFFFLSNDELLQILSETKDPLRVQPFVRKCFECINTLKFDEELNIHGMISEENEYIPFDKTFNPKQYGGNVEEWLTEVQTQMRVTLKTVMGNAVADYPNKERTDWIKTWPGQIVLNGSQAWWTLEAEEAAEKGKSQGFSDYSDKCTRQLQATVEMVRSPALPKLARKTVGALTVIDVHARDVLSELYEEGCESKDDFSWLSQLRYYWEDVTSLNFATGATGMDMAVRITNAVRPYGYEYLGNSGRLVITPLTDRCYRTLIGAIHLNMGGAPEGPAGTGKTETTKDLAKALAMPCVVFNCSDGLDYLAMAKFFKGLIGAGAWACFDEFNRIDVEVLSVIAQQILDIQRAVAARVKSFLFEGTEMELNPLCNVFITMNPGYAGRAELPDNLKALFRPVAMMVPDYALISEIILYSFGYLEARKAGQQIVATYRLCSEQLSSQDHYDYGMRAVISVLRAAGNLKQRYPDMEEGIAILRSIKDVNEPKFLAFDIPLFQGILSDLFPGVVLPEADYTNLNAAMLTNCEKLNVQPTDVFLLKTIQLYEMILVRHGLMIVGYSYGAKSSMYRVLAGSLTDLHAKGLENENKVQVKAMNPKSIKMGQLYGEADPVSQEWTEGVLAVNFRSAAVDTSPDRKWILLDGPVDAIWIENMNTVLDDNKKLCLNNGEIIQMSAQMNMIFEVQDLAVASPATVSRCGMIYVEPSQIGWRPLFVSWLKTLPDLLQEESKKELIEGLFDWLIDPALRFVKKYCREPQVMLDINLVVTVMNLFESHMDGWKDLSIPSTTDQELLLVNQFIFAVIWGIGGMVDDAGRKLFSDFLRKMLDGQDPGVDLGPETKVGPPNAEIKGKLAPIPDVGLVYEYVWFTGKLPTARGEDEEEEEVVEDEEEKDTDGRWQHFLSTELIEPPSTEVAFHEIIVTNTDTVRYAYLLKTFITHDKHVCFTGPTGTGKSVYVKSMLMQGLDKELYVPMFLNFSAQTSANATQDIIDGKLEKRRKGVFGPTFGKKCVIFVDDLNMPEKEVYGAQPPVELLRQWMDHDGWFDLADQTFRKLVDLQFVAATGPPGGGRNEVTQRYLRHFAHVYVAPFDDASLEQIFSVIMQWWADKNGVRSELSALSTAIVQSTIDVYRTVESDLLPTPSKSHYTFNLRDLSKVIGGVTSAGGSVNDVDQLVRLWTHESLRVFSDRLIDDADRTWFNELIAKMIKKHFDKEFNKVFATLDKDNSGDVDENELRHLMFGDYMVPGAEPRIYAEITDSEELIEVINTYLSDFNETSKKPMSLVMFLFAIEHTSRISRVIRQPYGNALLVGVGGSGRKSLTILATYMAEYDHFTIEVSKGYGMNEWRDDLRKVLKQAGMANKPTVFMIDDTQIKMESFVEDISNLLNTGEVPNLFPADEKTTILDGVKSRAKAAKKDGSPAEMFAFFVDSCRENLHMCLCFSPIGEAFRTRLRKFPSLVNCCTIDWFSEWPGDALIAVAEDKLGDVDMEASVKSSVVEVCMEIHSSVSTLGTKFFAEARRHYYVTPTSYLELIQTFKNLLDRKRKEVSAAQKRYDVGLEKLEDTETQVKSMQEELVALQPQLVIAGEETDKIIAVVETETESAMVQKAEVEVEEKAAQKVADEANAIKEECEEGLAEAIPALEAAVAALNTLTQKDIGEVKSLANPPSGVKLVMEAVCVMFQIKPDRVKDKDGKMVNDMWKPSQKLLQEKDFLASLTTYDKDNIDPAIIKNLQPYMQNPDFAPEVIKKVSKACYGLCCWVRAMDTYDRVAKMIAPKRAALAEAEAKYEEVMEKVEGLQADLAIVMKKLDKLNSDLTAAQKKKEDLAAQVDDCAQKLDRAQKLISGLGGEKVNWRAASTRLGEAFNNLTGDILISSAVIAYLGAFTSTYRDEVVPEWATSCSKLNIPSSPNFSLTQTLGNQVEIRKWNIDGLPKDSFSVDNGVIMANSSRWPLLIDPQGQANRWIKEKEAQNKLIVTKLSESKMQQHLETCLQLGFPCLIENVGEQLDATLEPVLLKQFFKQGSGLGIKLGDNIIEYNRKFQLYMTTRLSNPHYLPEVSVKVTLINFMITQAGLFDQLLGIVSAEELPALEEEKNRLVLEGAANKQRLTEIEDEILRVLSESEGNILDDAAAVDTLGQAKVIGNEIQAKQKIAEETEVKIDVSRQEYEPVAFHASLLYFCIVDLGLIDPMYQYSLTWFIKLYVKCIHLAEPSDDLPIRLQSLKDCFLYNLFAVVCVGLFEKDKLLFALMLLLTLQRGNGVLNEQELRFLLTGGVPTDREMPKNPAEAWLVEKQWGEAVRLSDIAAFAGLHESITATPDAFFKIYNSPTPQTEKLPGDWDSKLNSFEKLLVLRIIRPDKVTLAVSDYVGSVLGERFVQPPAFDLNKPFEESDAVMPLTFILSAGSDPLNILYKMADDMRQPIYQISLGQGQGPKAEAKIAEGLQAGDWVVLSNCHLAKSWMPKLEVIVEELDPDRVHKDFRLWLTSYPSPDFPTSVLQAGIKITNEPPKGVRANIVRSYNSDPVQDPKFFEASAKPFEWKRLLFGLCFFHAQIQERRKFGPLGWNVPYEFNDSDLKISVRQLQMFIDEYPEAVPFKALNYLTGECNYGGRVTDAQDRRTLIVLLKDVFCKEMLAESHSMTPSGKYMAPPEGELKDYTAFAQTLPASNDPEVFGLHANADITKDLNETMELFDAVLSTQPRVSSGGGLTAEETVDAMCADILGKLPSEFDLEAIAFKYPQDYYESMNTVLVQECTRYNGLISLIRGSLQNVRKAIKGTIVMNQELDTVLNAMYANKVPEVWKKKSHASRMSFAAYMADFFERLDMYRSWYENGRPSVFWLSGLFFTPALTTAAMQNYARKNKIAIDLVSFDHHMMDGTKESYTEGPDSGIYIHGLYFEGARWDAKTSALAESEAKVLFTPAPVVWLQVCVTSEIERRVVYMCPIYKTADRRGVLSTTGHSSNFVFDMKVPTKKPPAWWTKRGTALLTQLLI